MNESAPCGSQPVVLQVSQLRLQKRRKGVLGMNNALYMSTFPAASCHDINVNEGSVILSQLIFACYTYSNQAVKPG